VPAAEAHDLAHDGDHYARTHNGRLKRIEASDERHVDEEITRIELGGLPWELAVTNEHPVLVRENEDLTWKLAGDIEEGDVLLEPVGPEHEAIVYQHYDRGKGPPYRWTIPQTGESIEALMTLQGVEPPPNDRFMTTALTGREEFVIDRAFDLPGRKYDQRRKLGITRLRREMAEKGLPSTIVGASIRSLRPILRRWAEIDRENTQVFIDITPDRVRPVRQAWGMYNPYEPNRSDEEATRACAYTLMKAFSAAGTPAALEETEDGYRICISGLDGGRLLFTHYGRNNRNREPRRWKGENIGRSQVDGRAYIHRPVTSITRERYTGPVYAFQVEGDESFVAAGVATHNSKVAMGETLMPGAGLEATGILTGSEAPLEAENIGRDAYDTAMRTLDVQRDRDGSWAKEAVTKRLMDAGAAVRTEAVYVDEQTKMTAVADAATKSNNPILIEEVSGKEFNQLQGMRSADRERLNAAIGASGRKEGMMVYTNAQTGEVSTAVQRFNSGLYNKSLQKLQAGRQMAKQYAAQGYGSPGAMYGTVDRLRVLQNADPFSDEWQVEMRKVDDVEGQ
jgi:hypothetical protein